MTGQTLAMNFGYNLFTNGLGRVSTKRAPKSEVMKTKPKSGDISRTPEIEIKFNKNDKHDASEFSRQLRNQQEGMNKLTVVDYIKNRADYLANGRSSAGNAAQKAARDNAFTDKYNELRQAGLSRDEAKSQASSWLDSQAALHNPDQIAGGFAQNVTGVGDARVNSSIGSQWKSRIGEVDEVVDNIARTTPYEDLSKMYLNVKLIP
ncbi:polymorphic toxin type 15 domain-containing protein [Alloscardovia omnicolens]|uniref:polymorphic toxin type 15 domain-containing protein n=1 Tax=Alloscardovia omnicolens TaxID=419015 RepID=UPI003A62CDB9